MTSNLKGATKKLAVIQHPTNNQPPSREEILQRLPAVEVIQQELASAKSVEDFFGR